MAVYEWSLIVVSLAILGAVVLPRFFADKPMSFPLVYVIAGFAIFSLPVGVPAPDPVQFPRVTERLTELVVIIALMGAGLKLDRPFDWRAWSTTWRLLGITMPLTIAAAAILGWWVLDLNLATAVLLGAVVAPTDPVLASTVEATPPTAETDEEVDPTDQEGAIRFALTSEAGLNDGLAFPFTNLAIVMAGVSLASADASSLASLGWLGEWFLFHVLYKIVVGVIGGVVVGYLIARFIFGRPSSTDLARVMEGAEALAATLLAYAATELVHGYGFIAVFVAALVLRHYEWEHAYYEKLHDFAVLIERLLMAAVLVLFGGTIAGGLLGPLTVMDAVVGLVLIVLVRPLAGLLGMVGTPEIWQERAIIASYGVRGIGSFYYLSHALNAATFQEFELVVATNQLWAFLGFVVVASLVLHGITAAPVMNTIDEWRSEHKEDFSVPAEEAD
ncbi:cation:proton antiporter [Halosimplex salinum]|uniref:cation:proton antiporter n=1 Tax=Halosimplex salinum TaxID=1710538 RepID=UPI000F49DDB0|nr:cation:proton antiporter [Halosimplex salinum]